MLNFDIFLLALADEVEAIISCECEKSRLLEFRGADDGYGLRQHHLKWKERKTQKNKFILVFISR